MKGLATNNRILIIISVGLCAFGTILSVTYKDFGWLSRFGALIVGVGVVALSRTFILGRDLLDHVGDGVDGTNLNLNGPEYYHAMGKPVPDYVAEDLRSRFAMGVLGPVLSILGSIIWGFADLINNLIPGFGVSGG